VRNAHGVLTTLLWPHTICLASPRPGSQALSCLTSSVLPCSHEKCLIHIADCYQLETALHAMRYIIMPCEVSFELSWLEFFWYVKLQLVSYIWFCMNRSKIPCVTCHSTFFWFFNDSLFFSDANRCFMPVTSVSVQRPSTNFHWVTFLKDWVRESGDHYNY